ncbi:hypothetical protein XELAEV_18010001mg [Xenopus laevis]|uniref:Tyr recombinase domain-containing protein n=1 Tax=Xenopus laevis TaxID=8355 RepID=A0A974I0X8_XENLA|nr:hypothetical protein XELAEV_18010001mg [Xenopus laevis]
MARKSQTMDQRKPITLNLVEKLLNVLNAVCFDDFEVTLFQCLFSFTYFVAFRISEIVASSKTADIELRSVNVTLFKQRLKIIIGKSKTDQVGRGNIIWLGPIKNTFLCPVSNYCRFLAVRPKSGSQFFIHHNKTPVTRFQFNKVLQKCVTSLGLQDEIYSSHSFRIGAATQASLLGFTEERIKKLGRWQSHRFHGIHLSEFGLDIFNIGLQTALERALLRWEVAKPH